MQVSIGWGGIGPPPSLKMISDDEIKKIGSQTLAGYKILVEAMADGSECARKEVLRISQELPAFAKDLMNRKMN